MYLTGIKTYFDLQRNLKKSLDQLRNEQWRAFQRLVRHAYGNVPFYKDLYDRAGFSPRDLKQPDDLHKVPMTRKRMFQQTDSKQLLAKGYAPERLVSKRTSGSSGFPLIIYYTPDDRIYRTLLHLRILFFNGMRFRDRMVQICDKRNVPGYEYMFQKFGWLSKQFLYCVKPAHTLLDELIAMNPDIIYSYTSSLALIADEIIKRGDRPIQVKLIFTTGELMNPYDRKKIEEAFSLSPRDIYGLVEMADVAWQCPALNGYHFNMDSALVEVEENNLKNEQEGLGKLVVTNLYAYAMPFIRYRVDDMVSIGDEKPCSCGCNFPRMKLLKGREDDWLFATDGRRISPMDITVARVRSIRQYRIIQKDYDHVVAELVPGRGFNKETVEGIKDHLIEVFGPNAHIDVKKVDHIELQSGKLRSIICEMEKS